jgi:hypothetical protein
MPSSTTTSSRTIKIIFEMVVAVSSPQQASGQSIFWALAAIVLNAMLQPSSVGYSWNGVAFEGTLWPHRSSPAICALDTTAESYILIKKLLGAELNMDNAQDEPRTTANPVNVTMRIAIFALGVLPQAIKLFSMRGIPATQGLAAIFFAASLISMVRTICLEVPHEEVSKLAGRLKKNGARTEIVIGIAGMTLHVIPLFYAWYAIAGKAQLPVTDNVSEIVKGVINLTKLLVALYVTQHIAIMLLGFKTRIPRYPIIILLFYSNTFAIADLTLDPKVRQTRKKNSVWDSDWVFAATLLLHVALCSYGIAYVLDFAGKLLLKWPNRSSAGSASHTELPMTNLSGRDAINSMEDIIGAESAERTTANSANSPSQVQGIILTVPQRTVRDSIARAECVSDSDLGANASAPISSANPEPSVNEPTSILAIHDGTGGQVSRSEEGGDQGGGSVESPVQSTPSQAEMDPFSFPYNLLFYPMAGVGLLILIFLQLADVIDLFESDRQSAAEEGAAGKSVEEAPGEQSPLSIWQRLLPIVGLPFKFIIKWMCKLLWRFILSVVSLFGYTFNWVKLKISNLSLDTLMVAFGILNFGTAMVYYLVLFDGNGTSMPVWTSVLG